MPQPVKYQSNTSKLNLSSVFCTDNDELLRSIGSFKDHFEERNCFLITGETGTGKTFLCRSLMGVKKACCILPYALISPEGSLASGFLIQEIRRYLDKHDCEEDCPAFLIIPNFETLAKNQLSALANFLDPSFSYSCSTWMGFDLRLVFLSTLSLDELMNHKNVPHDFLCGISPYHIHLHPLRDRMGDLGRLSNFFFQVAYEENRIDPISIPTEFRKECAKYSFPGNLSELRAMIYHCVAQSKEGRSISKSIQHWIQQNSAKKDSAALDKSKLITFSSKDLPTISQVTKALIDEAMKRSDGNQTRAAKFLGISQQALSERLRRQTRA